MTLCRSLLTPDLSTWFRVQQVLSDTAHLGVRCDSKALDKARPVGPQREAMATIRGESALVLTAKLTNEAR